MEQTTVVASVDKKPAQPPTFAEAFRFWLKLGFISFGGPTGQIAIMHAELTVKHNGVLIHDKAEVDSTTTSSGINTVTHIGGPIQLQDHGNPIYYRNIWAVRR